MSMFVQQVLEFFISYVVFGNLYTMTDRTNIAAPWVSQNDPRKNGEMATGTLMV